MKTLNDSEIAMVAGGTLGDALGTTLTDTLAGLDVGLATILGGVNSTVNTNHCLA